MEISADEMETCLRVLQRVADSRGSIRRSDHFNALIAKVYRQSKKFDLRAERQRQWTEDRAAQAETAMVRIQRDALSAGALALPPVPAPPRILNRAETCYICKEDYSEVHFFYHLLCPKCAEINFTMRHLSADLRGRTALITGGRVKIGYQAVLRLLRDGAKVILTTRFPNAAARRFFAESDSGVWRDRLQVYGLDLRNLPSVEQFVQHLLHTEPAIDIVIHNAAQTIARPPGFYTELLAGEEPGTLGIEASRLVAQNAPVTTAADSISLLPAMASPAIDVLPANKWEDNEERADSRTTNSWLLRLDEVSAPEMLEVQLVNSVAPFLLNSRLKPLLMRSPFARRFIVNVSAMEGQFSRH
ncbi:MAG: SDR family NAD(P)-dependent oxidoreductase, partial [Fibrella sp.]|nr:SDR family NAD(P)-dependent oxidoreductase [Armatimonadota bacterium]